MVMAVRTNQDFVLRAVMVAAGRLALAYVESSE